jgi:hypothetical protein
MNLTDKINNDGLQEDIFTELEIVPLPQCRVSCVVKK